MISPYLRVRSKRRSGIALRNDADRTAVAFMTRTTLVPWPEAFIGSAAAHGRFDPAKSS
jgi:hypothetical protein